MRVCKKLGAKINESIPEEILGFGISRGLTNQPFVKPFRNLVLLSNHVWFAQWPDDHALLSEGKTRPGVTRMEPPGLSPSSAAPLSMCFGYHFCSAWAVEFETSGASVY